MYYWTNIVLRVLELLVHRCIRTPNIVLRALREARLEIANYYKYSVTTKSQLMSRDLPYSPTRDSTYKYTYVYNVVLP